MNKILEQDSASGITQIFVVIGIRIGINKTELGWNRNRNRNRSGLRDYFLQSKSESENRNRNRDMPGIVHHWLKHFDLCS